jgi:hypothetical protein
MQGQLNLTTPIRQLHMVNFLAIESPDGKRVFIPSDIVLQKLREGWKLVGEPGRTRP